MMWFTGLGVGHLDYKAHEVHALTVEDEPDWSQLCAKHAASAPEPVDTEPEEESESDGSDGEDLDSGTD